jgi:L-threonylcarbamoyladenylate synthase
MSDQDLIQQFADLALAGGVFAFPTETVYGLGANASDDAAVAKIFALKGRPSDHPLIVHVASAADVDAFACAVPGFANALMQAFWPGPLTLILPRRAGVAAAAAGGQDSVGLRCPSHPLAQALLKTCASLGVTGLAAPSANRFGRISPSTAAHVQDEFGLALPVLDGGACAVGIESCIIDCTRAQPVLLRPGVLTRGQIEAACGMPVQDKDGAAPKASGTLTAHYAPRAKLHLLSTVECHALLLGQRPQQQPGAMPFESLTQWALYCRNVPSNGSPSAPTMQRLAMANTPQRAAQHLFADLRALDALGVKHIGVEMPPEGEDWEGVRDRLTRAAAAGAA